MANENVLQDLLNSFSQSNASLMQGLTSMQPQAQQPPVQPNIGAIKSIANDPTGGTKVDFHPPDNQSQYSQGNGMWFNPGPQNSSGGGGLGEAPVPPTTATPKSSVDINTDTPEDPMAGNGFALGMMMGGMGLQGQNPMEILKGLMSSKLAQQEYMGKKPITKYETASLAQNKIKILRDQKKDQLTNITDQMKQVESKVGGIHALITKEPYGESKKQWDSLYAQAEAKRKELEDLDNRLTGDNTSNQAQPNFPKDAKPGDRITIGETTYEFKQ